MADPFRKGTAGAVGYLIDFQLVLVVFRQSVDFVGVVRISKKDRRGIEEGSKKGGGLN